MFRNCECTLLLVFRTEYFKQFEVLTNMIVKITVLEDVVLRSLVASYHYFRRSFVPPCSRQESCSSYQKSEVAGSSEALVHIHKTIPITSQKFVMSELYVCKLDHMLLAVILSSSTVTCQMLLWAQ